MIHRSTYKMETDSGRWETYVSLPRERVLGDGWSIRSVSQSVSQSVQSLSCVRLSATPWIAACQASLSITNSWSSLKPIFIELVMPSSHLILSSPSPPAPNPSQHQSLFQVLASKCQLWYVQWINTKVLVYSTKYPRRNHDGKQHLT